MDFASTLNPADAPTAKVVQHLRLMLTEADVATATKVDPRTVRRWMSGEVEPHARNAELLDDLRAITELLETLLNAEGVKRWLRRRSVHLDDDRPIERLRDGDFSAVRKAAMSYLQGGSVAP